MSDNFQQSLDYHSYPTPGKIATQITKDFGSIKNLSLAYSPYVANPCMEIYKDIQNQYKYTNKGNLVAIVSNGTAVLGLGNIGPEASKPVMEGKAALMKSFCNIDSFDICIKENNPEKLVDIVASLEPTFGAINLEDIKGPECFYVEEQLKQRMNIPVFHDDQHGTAIVILAGIINSLILSSKKIEDCKIVVNGAGAAGIACIKLLMKYGAKKENIYVCDTNGVIYKERSKGLNEFKLQFANPNIIKDTTLIEISKGADILIGVSSANAFNNEEMIMSLNKNPIIFALANPNPEITPDQANKYRPDCIIATGRSDYNNQVNNVLCFPYLFRGVLDCNASQINEEMKIAAAESLASIARMPKLDVIKELTQNYDEFGKSYIIPSPFDNRIIEILPIEIIKKAIETKVAKKTDINFEEYKNQVKNQNLIISQILNHKL